MEQEDARRPIEGIDSLSDRQREVLRLVSRDMNSKEIGRSLGLSDETIKNHIKAATRRLGVSSRFDAARLLRVHEGDDPRVANDPSRVIAILNAPPQEGRQGAGSYDDEVREPRAFFDVHDHDFGHVPRMPRPADRRDDERRSALRIVTLIAVLTVALAIAGISAAPLARSVQELANMIEAPRAHH